MQLLYYNDGAIFMAFDFSFSGCFCTKFHAGKMQSGVCVCVCVLDRQIQNI